MPRSQAERPVPTRPSPSTSGAVSLCRRKGKAAFPSHPPPNGSPLPSSSPTPATPGLTLSSSKVVRSSAGTGVLGQARRVYLGPNPHAMSGCQDAVRSRASFYPLGSQARPRRWSVPRHQQGSRQPGVTRTSGLQGERSVGTMPQGHLRKFLQSPASMGLCAPKGQQRSTGDLGGLLLLHLPGSQPTGHCPSLLSPAGFQTRPRPPRNMA